MRLILASTSPRRREILGLLGLPFEVIAPIFEEKVSARSAIEEEVLGFAVGKAASVAVASAGAIIIGSDTMISCGGIKIGKPADAADARRILRLLSGQRHTIYTSVAILDDAGGPGFRVVEMVEIDMHDFNSDEIDSYLARGESMDKAGAYSIQGAGSKLIRSMKGDYLAAVGMPLKPVAAYLESRGIIPERQAAEIYRQKAFENWRLFE